MTDTNTTETKQQVQHRFDKEYKEFLGKQPVKELLHMRRDITQNELKTGTGNSRVNAMRQLAMIDNAIADRAIRQFKPAHEQRRHVGMGVSI